MSESLRRAVQILDALSSEPDELSARELAARINLPKSTAQRLLQSLEELDLAEQNPRTRKYRLGPRTLTFGMAYRSRLDIRAVALPHMVRLRDLTGETVGLSAPVGQERMYLEQVPSRSELRRTAEVGRPYPLWTGAPGRVLLAALDDAEVERVLARAGDEALRVLRPRTREAFFDAVEKVRRQQYAMGYEETIAGVNTVAAPIHDGGDTVIAALSVSGPSLRFTGEVMDGVLPDLRETAAAVSRALGGHPRGHSSR
ncbi:MAG: IclR family transcriptional regulator [Micromonosporaceae bacterium]